MILSRLLFSLIFTISTGSLARSLDNDFRRFYESDRLSSRHCGRNIDEFAAQLESENKYPRDMLRLEIENPRGSWGFGRLIALSARWARGTGDIYQANYSFHVVALHRGIVYDFSFGPNARPLPLADYLDQMFLVPNSITNFMPMGSTFRIQDRGPEYLREDSIKELRTFHYQLSQRIDHGWKPLAKYDDTQSLINAMKASRLNSY